MARPSSKARVPMSLESVLDEENRTVLADLDRRRGSSPLPRAGYVGRNATPPPIRSMLDVESPVRSPRGSTSGLSVGLTSPLSSTRRKSVQLDPSDPSTYTTPHASKPNSPVLTKASPVVTRERNSSEQERPVGLPKVGDEDKRGFEQNYQFDMASIPSSAGTSARSQTDSKRPREGSSSAMAAAMSGDYSSLHLGSAAGRNHNSSSATAHSRSPASPNRRPEASKVNNLLIPSSTSNTLTTSSGTVVDDQAHRRLSNKSSSFSTVNTEDSEEVPGPSRVQKDGTAEEEVLVESSEDDVVSPSSDEDETRGRPGRRKTSDTGHTDVVDSIPLDISSLSEGEKKQPATTQSVKSLLEPSISITSPTGENLTEGKTDIQSMSNVISPPSVVSGDEDDEDETAAAIKKAKSLALNMSPLDSTVADRHVRIVLRGDWAHFHQEAEADRRTARLYLVCSDLSTEALYAMEWVVGTMLRDGDTLLAINAIEDENAGKTTEADREILQAEGTQAGKDASEVMATLTRQTTQGGGTSIGLSSTNKYIPATEVQSLTGSVDARKTSKKEMERLHAVEEITQNFIKLVRKTTLQVRCMVEVIHCKSPKHLILGAIDQLEPTLCVVGTRGRSSLKGVLLGSFSNYLVTKSSVPVMVARKRLKKPRSQIKVSSNKIRLSNNLTASNMPSKRKSLTQARID